MLYKLTTRLSAEVGRYVIDCLPSSNQVQRFAPTGDCSFLELFLVKGIWWSSRSDRGYLEDSDPCRVSCKLAGRLNRNQLPWPHI